jgi:putrescine aminotransferase
VGEAVMTGLVGGVQLCADKDARVAFPEKAEVGLICREHSLAAGLVMRAVGDRMVVSPPLVLSHEEADLLGGPSAHRARPDGGGYAEPRADLRPARYGIE